VAQSRHVAQRIAEISVQSRQPADSRRQGNPAPNQTVHERRNSPTCSECVAAQVASAATVSCWLQTELVDLCDKVQWSSVGARRYCQPSRPTTVHFITLRASSPFSRAKLTARSTIDMPWRNFPSPEFRQKSFRGKYPYFCRCLNFLKTQCRTGRKKLTCQKNRLILRSFLLIEHRLVTDRQTDRQTHGHSQYPRWRSVARVKIYCCKLLTHSIYYNMPFPVKAVFVSVARRPPHIHPHAPTTPSGFALDSMPLRR